MTAPPSASVRMGRGGARPSGAVTLAIGFLPGALAGIHLAALLFFLNPSLPFRLRAIVQAAIFYGVLLGLSSLALNLPFTWKRTHRARRVLPWEVTAVLAASALLGWTHASYYAYFLPSGINDRLITAAIWLTLGALVAFYTALLHTLHRRPYGPRSRTCLTMLCVLSVFVMFERREAFHPRPPLRLRPTVVEAGARPRLLVVGLDTGTLDAILPLAGQGRLPFFAKLLRDGAYARLEALAPARRESLWLSLATGKYPWKHGVTSGRIYGAELIAPGSSLNLLPVGIGFSHWGIPGTGGTIPHSYARQALALWEILPRLGIPSGVVDWPATSPVSRETVFALSDRLFSGSSEDGVAWPPDVRRLVADSQPSTAQTLSLARTAFGAAATSSVVRGLAGDSWRFAVAGALLDRYPEVGAMFVVLPGLRPVSRSAFGGYEAVQFGSSPSPEALLAAKAVAAYYSNLDVMLSELWKRRSGSQVMAVVSAYGIEGPRGLRRLVGAISPGGALEGHSDESPDGLFLLYGEGIRPGALLTGADLVDVAPTLLYGLGFPVARDLDGQVLTTAFDKGFLGRHPLTFLPSYEALAPASAKQ